MDFFQLRPYFPDYEGAQFTGIASIGLGSDTQVDELAVDWPDGVQTLMMDVAAGQTLLLTHPSL